MRAEPAVRPGYQAARGGGAQEIRQGALAGGRRALLPAADQRRREGSHSNAPPKRTRRSLTEDPNRVRHGHRHRRHMGLAPTVAAAHDAARRSHPRAQERRFRRRRTAMPRDDPRRHGRSTGA